MVQWEYERLLKIHDWNELKQILNRLGLQGWEICAEDQHKYILKRPYQEEKPITDDDFRDFMRGL